MKPTDPGFAGQHVYSPAFLRVYDLVVLRLYATLVWRCPTRRLVAHYERHLGRRHLDVGPGTGFFLEHARLPTGFRLVLLDPNANVIKYARRRLKHLNPSTLQADICAPLAMTQQFDSIALNYVLHCLPGPMSARAHIIRGLAAQLAEGGVLFGASVLGTPRLHTWLSRAALQQNNRLGIFDNLADTQEALSTLLNESFALVNLEIVGSVAVFAARKTARV